MAKSWFTDEEARGTLTLEKRANGWFVVSPGDVGKTKCILRGELQPEDSRDVQEMDVMVSNFRWGTGNNVNFLYVTSPGTSTYNEESDQDTDDQSQAPNKGRDRNINKRTSTRNQWREKRHSSTNKMWELNDFRGSGEYVDIEATIDAVFSIKKDVRGIPDMKGELTDDSVFRPVIFIVQDDVSHPYLDEGTTFRFENVKDHYYKKKDEIQVVINKNTRFTEIS